MPSNIHKSHTFRIKGFQPEEVPANLLIELLSDWVKAIVSCPRWSCQLAC
jgi:hypothetical protein